MLRTFFQFLVIFVLLAPASHSFSQSDSTSKKTAWYDRINVRGYVQVRYNRLLETNPNLGCDQCDKSWGDDGGLFLRRARIIFFGQINPRVYFYIQPDFASSSGTGLHYGQLRDAYFDLGLNANNSLRVRLGQSKVPFGFENMQSSSNRLPLDRADGTNSAFPNERDLGAFFYWAPVKKRELLARLTREGLKGSGDYGMFAFGVFNGQGANKAEQNNTLHMVSRFSFPVEIGSQIIEPGVQAYTGQYVLTSDQISSGTKIKEDRSFLDQRVGATFILYPKPIGFNVEYNIGKGPEFNTATDSVELKSLHGGYAMLSARVKIKNHLLYPFTRYQFYQGGKKFEKDARSYDVNDLEIGVEWQPSKAFELVAMYVISDRRYEDYGNQSNRQTGNLLRLQAQLNF
ncbi:MAG: porin [Flavobacteriales bacterium]